MNYEIVIPELDHQPGQDEEWIIVKRGNRQEKIRLHDYKDIYKLPGLYEQLFCQRLRCNSPRKICQLLEEARGDITDCRVLDFGAGNGMVGEEITKRGSNLVVGVDILSEAKEATERDRAGIYDKYYVMDLDDPDDKDIEKLEQYDFNTLISVAALGFDDIPPRAFLNAFNLIKDGGWVAFNIKDRFLTNKDDTGYKDIITGIRDSNMTILCEKRYCHRLSLSGEELYYIAIIGRKMAGVNLSEVDI